MRSDGQGPYRLTFIAGPPRSGTTWLNRELCNHPGFAPFLPECSFLTQQVALYSQTKHYAEAKRFAVYFGSKENLASQYREVIRRMIDLTLQINKVGSGDRVILKDPELSHHVGDLADILPDHQLVCIVRDPRDVMASIKKVSERKQQPWDVESACGQIFRYFGCILAHQRRKPMNTIFVRYEDLVTKGLDPVRAFIGQDAAAGGPTAQASEALQAHFDKSDPFFSDLYFKPTTTEMIGSYAAILTEAEIRRIEAIFSGVLSRWGYAPWSPAA